MKHLAKMIANEINHELKNKKVRKVSNNSRGKNKQNRIALKINGFWFCLTRMNWAEYSGVGYGTIVGRDKANRPPAQILGYEPIPKSKKLGRPVGSKDKVSFTDKL